MLFNKVWSNAGSSLAKVHLRAQPVAAQMPVSEIIDHYYGEFATEESGRYFWWCREVLVDPFELIVDSGNQLWRVPFTVTADGIEFGEPREVRIEYVDALARSDQVAAALNAIASVRGDKVAARFDTRPDRPQPQSQQGGDMDLSELRRVLNLSADTPDAEVLRIAQTRLSGTEGEPEGEGEGQPAPEGEPEGEPEGDTPPAEGGTATTTESTVTIDRGALESLQAQAADGAEARRVQLEAETNRILDQAIEDGKFPAARRQHWANLMAQDRDGTIQTIEDLEENVVPVKLRSVSNESGTGQGAEAYPVHILPEVAAKKERIAAGARPRIMTDRG